MAPPIPLNQDEEARKKGANKLTEYFGGAQAQAPVTPPAAPQAPAPTNTGTAAQKAPAAPATPSTNVGSGAAVGQAPQPAATIGAPVQQRSYEPRPLPQPGPAPLTQQAPTNFVNFQRYFNANKGASDASAQRLAGNASNSAADAAAKLQLAQQDFAAQQAAGVGGPIGAAQPGTDPGDASGTNSAVPDSQALTGESTRGMTSADYAAQSNYSGPGSLGDVKSSQAAYDAAGKASDQLGALGSTGGIKGMLDQSNPDGANTSAFSAGLVGASGAGQFDKLRAAFNPDKNLSDAQAASAKAGQAAADKAKAMGLAAASAKTGEDALASQIGANNAAAGAQKNAAALAADRAVQPPQRYNATFGRDSTENRQAFMMTGVDPKDPAAVAARQAEIKQYEKAQEMTTQNVMDQTFADINSFMSPSSMLANATGNKDNTQSAAQGAYNKSGVASASGSTDQNHIPWDKAGADGFFVWRQMDAKQWEDLNRRPSKSIFGNDKQNWIEQRATDLRNAAKAQQNKPPAPAVGRTQAV